MHGAVADSLPGLLPGFRPFVGRQPLCFALSLGLCTVLKFFLPGLCGPYFPDLSELPVHSLLEAVAPPRSLSSLPSSQADNVGNNKLG